MGIEMTSVRSMYWNQGTRLAAALCALLLTGGIPDAGAKGAAVPLPVQSAQLVQTIDPADGFIDDPFTFDSAGSRLLYVNSDTGTTAKVVVLDVFQRTELRRVSLSKFTLKPSKVEFAIDGEHFLVWTEEKKTGRNVAALLSNQGKVIRRFGPALDIVRTTYDGQEALVVHDVSSPKLTRKQKKEGGDDLPVVRHTVAVYNIATGKLLGKKTELDLTADDKNAKLDFALKFWASDFTVAVGIKGGEWDRKEDQRSPDFEGHYEMPTRTFSKRLPIKDLRKHRERMFRMAKYSKRSQNIVVKHNLTGLDLVSNGEFTPIALQEHFHHYDSTTLVVQAAAAGSIFFTLTIDPVHPDAAARRRAVKPWTDLYEYDLGTKKARRRARLLAKKGRKHAWRANSTHWAVMPRHIGFDRGGSDMQVYRLK
jgi:hypothetical protein